MVYLTLWLLQTLILSAIIFERLSVECRWWVCLSNRDFQGRGRTKGFFWVCQLLIGNNMAVFFCKTNLFPFWVKLWDWLKTCKFSGSPPPLNPRNPRNLEIFYNLHVLCDHICWKFAIFEKLKVLGYFGGVYLKFGKILNILWQIFNVLGQILNILWKILNIL